MKRPLPSGTSLRRPDAPIDPMFLDRWSPRALSSEPLPDGAAASLFEAARWAPSCFNEQPWLFLFATSPDDLARYRPILADTNRTWADRAPMLVVVFGRRSFARNRKPNRWAAFDSGAAWMSLALEARRLGLFAHAMGGFDASLAHEVTGVPESDFEALAAVAIGLPGSPDDLPADIASRETPSDRKPHAEVAIQGRYIRSTERSSS